MVDKSLLTSLQFGKKILSVFQEHGGMPLGLNFAAATGPDSQCPCLPQLEILISVLSQFGLCGGSTILELF